MTHLEIYERAKVLVHDKLDEVFTLIHKEAGTTSGDIAPEQAIELDEIELQLSKLITAQVWQNLPESNEEDSIYELMGYYLTNDQSELEEVAKNLRQKLATHPNATLESVEGINVWEKVEGMFSVQEFCDLVGITL